jgi:hypothetical protein
MQRRAVIIRQLLKVSDGKFNTVERREKLAAKQKSLEQLGLHKEAETFKSKIKELNGNFERKHPRDEDGQFASSGSGKKSAPRNNHPDAEEMHSALRSKGFGKNHTATSGEFMYHNSSGHQVKINEQTGEWKHYYPYEDEDGMPVRSKGYGSESLKKNLR